MAFDLHLVGIRGSEVFRLKGGFFESHRFMSDNRFRDITTNAGYRDYAAIVTPKEALEIVNEDTEKALKHWHHFDEDGQPCSDVIRVEKLRAEAVTLIGKSDFCIFKASEWESGLS